MKSNFGIGLELHYDRLRQEYYRYLSERQEIAYKRLVLRQPRPWTEDGVFELQRFSNVYRILDPTTQRVQRHIIWQQWPVADILLNLMAFRLLDGWKVWKHIGPLNCKQSTRNDEAELYHKLKDLRETDPSAFSHHGPMGASTGLVKTDRFRRLARTLTIVAAGSDRMACQLAGARTPELMAKLLRTMRGFSNSLIYQVVVDLLTPRMDGRSLFLDSSWINVWYCPISRRVSDQAMKMTGEWNREQIETELWRLRLSLPDKIRALGLPWHPPIDQNGKEIPPTLCDVIQSLHEFDRYQEWRYQKINWDKMFSPSNRKEFE